MKELKTIRLIFEILDVLKKESKQGHWGTSEKLRNLWDDAEKLLKEGEIDESTDHNTSESGKGSPVSDGSETAGEPDPVRDEGSHEGGGTLREDPGVRG